MEVIPADLELLLRREGRYAIHTGRLRNPGGNTSAEPPVRLVTFRLC
jgi:hypothetical protein